MRLIVSGSREGYSPITVERTLDRYLERWGKDDLVIIEGCAKGVDSQAYLWGMRRGVEVLHYPAPWEHLGKRAGAWRNRAMIVVARAEAVVCFHKDIANSKGTRDMAIAARKKGLQVHLVGSTMDLP